MLGTGVLILGVLALVVFTMSLAEHDPSLRTSQVCSGAFYIGCVLVLTGVVKFLWMYAP